MLDKRNGILYKYGIPKKGLSHCADGGMMADQIPFDALLAGIVTGKFKSGSRLVERDLVPQLGVSRTPVREAIRKLESLGLVRCLPKRGAVVTELSPRDIEDLYFVRLHQERLVAKLSFFNLGPEDIKNLQVINRELRLSFKKKDPNLREMIEKDTQFHQTIYRASNNDFLIQVINELRLKCYVIAYYAWRNPERVRRSIEEHNEMIKALKQKDRVRFQNMVEHQLIAAKAFYLENVE
ncbi:MAG: GntR family transcriptional regulator [Syntrophorhabdales bacterium]